ncbi:hypothetical protein TYRP_010490 [Tyrophagus putrescentiae]|nr:hypothetical protein TYRP_010490 [Tyrophagus putrescentiae]
MAPQHFNFAHHLNYLNSTTFTSPTSMSSSAFLRVGNFSIFISIFVLIFSISSSLLIPPAFNASQRTFPGRFLTGGNEFAIKEGKKT